MNIFFKTFLKVFASLLTIVVFFAVLFGFLSFIGSNKTNSQFTVIKGDQSSENKIAILKLQGPIVNDSININNIAYFQIINPEKIRKKLKSLEILQPKILIISINSPGGTVAASYEIYEMVKKFKEKYNLKLYFHTNETLASGAYWFALSGDAIYANYGSLVGSIGVKGPDWIYFDKPISMSSGIFGNAIETENGIKVYSQNAGKSKDMLNPFRQPTKEELHNIQLLINDIYDDFVNLVSKKRKIEVNIIKNKIGALIYNSAHAKNNYLIDGEMNLNSLINKIVEKNNFDNYQILESSNIDTSFFEKYFLQIFSNQKLDKKIIINNFICNNLRINISSIIPNYLSSC